MSFNFHATRLAVSSSKGTIHIFDINTIESGGDHLDTCLTSLISKSLGFNSSDKITEKPLRSFAKIKKIKFEKLSESTCPSIITLLKTTADDEEKLIVCLGNANFFNFTISSRGKTYPVETDDMLSFDDGIAKLK